jgi:hypothetical protein
MTSLLSTSPTRIPRAPLLWTCGPPWQFSSPCSRIYRLLMHPVSSVPCSHAQKKWMLSKPDPLHPLPNQTPHEDELETRLDVPGPSYLASKFLYCTGTSLQASLMLGTIETGSKHFSSHCPILRRKRCRWGRTRTCVLSNDIWYWKRCRSVQGLF